VALGLLLGKQIGGFRLTWANLSKQATYMQLYGIALLCGIGFTMRLFIGPRLADSETLQEGIKLGVHGLPSFCRDQARVAAWL